MGTWVCCAHPAALGGKECGHANTRGKSASFLGNKLEYCESCGCTKIASDDRERRKSQSLRRRVEAARFDPCSEGLTMFENEAKDEGCVASDESCGFKLAGLGGVDGCGEDTCSHCNDEGVEGRTEEPTVGIGRADYQERKEARIERYRNRAQKRRAEGTARIGAADRIAGMIPLGQPILVGHHSEKRHRRDIQRIRDGLRKGFELTKQADNLEQRAASAERNDMISSDDPEALDKLREKLVEFEAERDRWKAINKALTKKTDEAVQKALEALQLTARELQDIKLNRGVTSGKLFPLKYKVTNLGANIRRVKERLESLEKLAATKPAEDLKIGDCVIREEDNRVQLIFPGKPSEEIRRELKSHGFKWSPTAGAWQRLLSDPARYWAKRIAEGAYPKAVSGQDAEEPVS